MFLKRSPHSALVIVSPCSCPRARGKQRGFFYSFQEYNEDDTRTVSGSVLSLWGSLWRIRHLLDSAKGQTQEKVTGMVPLKLIIGNH